MAQLSTDETHNCNDGGMEICAHDTDVPHGGMNVEEGDQVPVDLKRTVNVLKDKRYSFDLINAMSMLAG